MENFGILNSIQYVKYEQPFDIEQLVNALKDLFCSLGSGHFDDNLYQIKRKSECDECWKSIKHDIENELRKSYMRDARIKEWTRWIVSPLNEKKR